MQDLKDKAAQLQDKLSDLHAEFSQSAAKQVMLPLLVLAGAQCSISVANPAWQQLSASAAWAPAIYLCSAALFAGRLAGGGAVAAAVGGTSEQHPSLHCVAS